ncbi:universal stress protein [Sphingomonas oryzagri]
MTYATLMIPMGLGKPNQDVLKVSADLAERFGASVIGVAACEGFQLAYGGPYVTADAADIIREQTERLTREAEAEFRTVLASRVTHLEWRAAETYGPVSEYLAAQARGADLIVAAAGKGADDLVMQAGRPALLVPPGASHAPLDRALVAWKDTREARRAVMDAVPLLQSARHVLVVEIAAADQLPQASEHLSDIAGWLRRHGIEVETKALQTRGSDAESLAKAATEYGAEVIVAGAYGHSRFREWILGGVTSDLLLDTHRFSLLSR